MDKEDKVSELFTGMFFVWLGGLVVIPTCLGLLNWVVNGGLTSLIHQITMHPWQLAAVLLGACWSLTVYLLGLRQYNKLILARSKSR